nr:hypothetical protein Iba_chr02aCG13060 [Ipomoea batatas]
MQKSELRTHCRNARKPAARRPPVTARRRRRSPHDAHRLPLTGVTARRYIPDRRRYHPESRPFEIIDVPKLQKLIAADFHSSKLQQAAVQSPVGKVTLFLIFLIFF